jgi:hypothetical protein
VDGQEKMDQEADIQENKKGSMSKSKDSRNRGFEEKAHLNLDQKVFESNHKEIFGEQKKFCDHCENRIAYCECPKYKDDKKEERR